MTSKSAALAATLLFTVASQESAPPATQGASRDNRTVVEKFNPLRASFGKATQVVVAKAKVSEAAVYKTSGERLDELPDMLGRRQYLSLALQVKETLDPTNVKLPPSIELRLAAPRLAAHPFIFTPA